MSKAFADAEVKKSKAVEKQEQAEEKDAEVVLTFDCKSIAFCTYHDLHVIGQFLKGHPDRMTNCHTRFKNLASRIAHQQTLDRFRDGNISLRDLRRYSHSTTRNLGSTLSLAGVVTRIAKAVVQLGTPIEKKTLELSDGIQIDTMARETSHSLHQGHSKNSQEEQTSIC